MLNSGTYFGQAEASSSTTVCGSGLNDRAKPGPRPLRSGNLSCNSYRANARKSHWPTGIRQCAPVQTLRTPKVKLKDRQCGDQRLLPRRNAGIDRRDAALTAAGAAFTRHGLQHFPVVSDGD